MNSLKHRVASGLLWRLLERLGTQTAGFVVSVILARLLTPADFGTVALTGVFLAVATAFVNGGFSTALVQKKIVSETELNSVFYMSLGVAIALYGILFAVSGWVARFYSTPVLVPILRFCALGIVFGALNCVQNALISKDMKFKLSFRVSVLSLLVSGSVGIITAIKGYGVWSLVAMTLSGQAVSTVALWALVGWRPKALFSWSAIRGLLEFGSKMLATGLLDTIFTNLYNIVIGKIYNPVMLGYYSRGQSVPNMAMTSVQGTIDSVIFPAMASCQHDTDRVRWIMRRTMQSTSFLIFPMMVGLAVVAEPLVLVLFTEKWLPCVPYLQLSCITFAFWPMHVANLQAVVALGRSDILLILEGIKKAMIVGIILMTYRHGVLVMVIGQAFGAVLCLVVNSWPNRRLINYALRRQIMDILPSALLAVAMGGLTWTLGFVIARPLLLLTAQVFAGAALYLGGAWLLKSEPGGYLIDSLRQFRLRGARAAV